MDTKKNILNINKFWVSLLLAQFFLFYIISKIDSIVSFNARFFDYQKNGHQLLFSTFPFSVGDIFYGILIIYLGFEVYLCFKKGLNKSLKRILILSNSLYFLYQIFWGLLYFQEPIRNQFPNTKIENKEVEKLAFKFLDRCKILRQQVNEDQNGIFQLNEITTLTDNLLSAQQKLPKQFSSKTTSLIKSVKPSLLNQLLSYTGISGYYNPFTAEAQYNPNLPDTNLGFTISHEMAHQLGYAREQEASFIGYLSCQQSGNIGLQYSSSLYALKSLISALQSTNPNLSKYILLQYSDGMKRDRLHEKQFSNRYYGKWSDFFSWTNDLFLKTNRQDGSISYSYFTELLIKHEQEL